MKINDGKRASMNRLLSAANNLSIRYKLLWGYTVISIFSTIIGGMIIYSKVKTTIETNIESELKNATATIKNMVETAATAAIKNHLRAVAERNKEIVAQIYADYASGKMTLHEAKEMARKILFSQTIGKTGYIYCAGSNGIAVEHPKPGVAGKNFMDHEFVPIMIRLKQGYLEYDWKNPGETKKRPKAMYMSYFEPWDWIISVSSYREEFKELINISDFKASILELKFGKSGYAYIIDTKGNIIVHPFLSGRVGDSKEENVQNLIKAFATTKNGKINYLWKNPGESNAREKIVFFNYLPEYDWIVSSASYLDEIFAPLKTIRTVIFLTVGSVIFLVFLASLWMNRMVIFPLKVLMSRLSVSPSGNFSARVPIQSSDEIGQLAGYFNNFMEKLQKYSTNLNASEEKYRTILERMEEGYFEVDLSGRFIFFNKSLETILRTESDILINTRIQSLTDSRNKDVLNQTFTKVKASGKPVMISDLELKTQAQSPCSVETSVSLLYDKEKRPTGFSGVIRDVTERKESEKALRLSEEMFSKAFRSSPSGMFIATIEEGKLLNVNDSLLKFTGYSLFELMGKNLPSINFFQDRSEVKRLIKILKQKGHIRHQEIKFSTFSGEIKTGVISAEMVKLWGNSCILASLEDITEARQLEREILNISERERQKIAMELHDDLCPQLIGIEVMTKILKEKLQENSDKNSEDAEKIRSLIQESIAKTRQLSKGLHPVNFSDKKLDTILLDFIQDIRDIFSIHCTLDYDDSVNIHDANIATHMYYIIHEAVINAVKHAQADKITIQLSEKEDKISLLIEDNGKGMPHSDKVQGVGIQLMEYRAGRIGGHLNISSSVSEGTCVLLEIQK